MSRTGILSNNRVFRPRGVLQRGEGVVMSLVSQPVLPFWEGAAPNSTGTVEPSQG